MGNIIDTYVSILLKFKGWSVNVKAKTKEQSTLVSIPKVKKKNTYYDSSTFTLPL